MARNANIRVVLARSAPAPPTWLARSERALALAATAVAVALHGRLLLCAGPLWRDEINTVAVATQPTLVGIWRLLERESFPLLPYVLLRAWSGLRLGTDAGLRVFGLVVGLSAVAALWWNRRRFGTAPPVLALVLFALNPVVVRWGDSIRGYGLGQLAVVLAFTLVFEVVRRPRPLTVGLAVLAAVAAVQTVYQNSVLVLAIGVGGAVVALAGRRFRRAGLALGIGAAAAVSLLPYLAVMARAREYRLVSIEGATPGHLASVFGRALGAEIGMGWPGRLLALGWVVAVAGALVTVAIHAGASRRRRLQALYGLLVLAIAIPAQLVFFLWVGFPTTPWYSLSLLAVMAVALEAMLQVASPAIRLGRLVLAAALLVLATPTAFQSLGLRQTNMDMAAAAVAGARPGDFVVVSPWFLGVSFNRYYTGAAPWATIPPLADTSVHRTDLLARQLQAEDPIGPLLVRIETTLRTGHRVYWVGLPAPAVARPPARLPPLPGPVNGTVQGIYCANWTQHVAAALREHGDTTEAVPLPPHRPPQPYEQARVWATTGRPGQVW
jgi:hypothetical protein